VPERGIYPLMASEIVGSKGWQKNASWASYYQELVEGRNNEYTFNLVRERGSSSVKSIVQVHKS
jgi:hypothetical protein